MKMLTQTEIQQAAQEALEDVDTSVLPIDPIAVARSNAINVIPSADFPHNIDGFIMRSGQDFVIGYRNTISTVGRINFTVGHELGHYFLPGHHQALCPQDGARHFCLPEAPGNEREVEADKFAAELLMPTSIFCREMGTLDRNHGGLGTVKKLADAFATSLTATANKYAQNNDAFCAVIISDAERIQYAFLSDALKDRLEGVDRYLKGKSLPPKATARKLSPGSSNEEQRDCYLDEWINGAPDASFSEEAISLGQFERILTVLYSEDFAVDDGC